MYKVPSTSMALHYGGLQTTKYREVQASRLLFFQHSVTEKMAEVV